MVLEAFAAVGLAGNICQFVDFTGKLFGLTGKIYRSKKGSSPDAVILVDITRDLRNICAELEQGVNNGQALRSSLVKLATECKATADDLINELDSISAKKPGSKWHSFKAALATTWKERQQDAMEKKLEKYRSQLSLELQIIQNGGWTDVLKFLHDQNRRFDLVLDEHISKMTEEIHTVYRKLEAQLKSLDSRQWKKKLEPANEDLVEAAGAKSYSRVTQFVRTEVIGWCSNMAVADSLRFEQMEFRHSKIRDAHPETFQWMFSNHFEAWLKSSHPIYWISGKPGSGKSTLMKYLVDNKQTPMNLREWSKSRKLLVSSYFFWANGTELQRSQRGLLQTLLHDILRRCPTLAKNVAPERWANFEAAMTNRVVHAHPPVWHYKELLDAFSRLAVIEDNTTAFCIFIDGLDEYQGDIDDLITTIDHLTRLRVKVCIASRPWNIFREKYGGTQKNRLYLEDLNKADIQRYVHDQLGARADFQSLHEHNDQAGEILDEIVQRSQGVFLWVYLVVRSMIDGLRNGDRMSQLQERLRSLPIDLESFYRHIIMSLDTFYQKQLAHMFQVTLVHHEPLSPLAYWFLDEQEDDPSTALTMPCQASSPKQLHRQMVEVQKRINGRSKGLLEITPAIREGSYNARVDFLHRTVKDFLMTTEMQEILKRNQSKDFDPALATCGALLAELKATVTMLPKDGPPIYRPLHCFIHAAKSLEDAKKQSPAAYLDELERVVEEHVRCGPRRSPGYPWTDLNCKSFLEVATESNLQIYLSTRLQRESQTMSFERKRTLLSQTATRKSWWRRTWRQGRS